MCRKVLGRRRRETCLTDLPDELLLRIIHLALDLQAPGKLSQRAIARFRTRGLTIALLSRRFNKLVRNSITCVEAPPRTNVTWARAMVVFARDSLTALHIATPTPWRARSPPRSSLCLLLAEVAPPLKELALAGLGGAPFEHVVSMLLALPNLREIDLQSPRPMDVAAISRTCVRLTRLSLGAVSHEKEVDEMRRQFGNLMCSPVAKTLTTLNVPWSCATVEAFDRVGENCVGLQRFGAEFGAMHWIRHRAFKATAPLEVDLCECVREQRVLFRRMLRGVSAHSVKSFGVRTMDGIPPSDLSLVFSSLTGLEDLDLLIGSSAKPVALGNQCFDLMQRCLGSSLKRVNVVGVSFTSAQVQKLADGFPKLESMSVWMGEGQRPAVDLFEKLGGRIRHLSLLCEWTEEMCSAVGRHNKNLESLFVVAKDVGVRAVEEIVEGVGGTLREFRLFLNRSAAVGEGRQREVREAASKSTTTMIVNEVARVVARGCENIETLNVSASCGGGGWAVDCQGVGGELRRMAPHLWQICDFDVDDR